MSDERISNPRLSPSENGLLRLRLQNYAEAHGLDQKAIGLAVGLTQQAVSTFFSGKTGVSRSTALRIAEFLGTNFDEIRRQAKATSIGQLAPDQAEALTALIADVGRAGTAEPLDAMTLMVMAESTGIPGAIAAAAASKLHLTPSRDGRTIEQDARSARAALRSYEGGHAVVQLGASRVIMAAMLGTLDYASAKALARSAISAGFGGNAVLEVLDEAECWRRAAVEVACMVVTNIADEEDEGPTTPDAIVDRLIQMMTKGLFTISDVLRITAMETVEAYLHAEIEGKVAPDFPLKLDPAMRSQVRERYIRDQIHALPKEVLLGIPESLRRKFSDSVDALRSHEGAVLPSAVASDSPRPFDAQSAPVEKYFVAQPPKAPVPPNREERRAAAKKK